MIKRLNKGTELIQELEARVELVAVSLAVQLLLSVSVLTSAATCWSFLVYSI